VFTRENTFRLRPAVVVRPTAIIAAAFLAGCGGHQTAGPVPVPAAPISVKPSGVPSNLPPAQQAAIAQQVAAAQARATAFRDMVIAHANAKTQQH
jgi:hypothetical protein